MKVIYDHRDSAHPQQAFIAFFDVLGFKARLERDGLRGILANYRQLAETKMRAGTIPVFSSAGSANHSVGSTIFSDCILFWCKDRWEAVQSLISASTYLVAAAIDIGWPLRGGLAYGECVLHRKTRTFIGQPIVDAVTTEESQQWIGAGLHHSVLEHPQLGKKIRKLEDIIEYAVPTKRGYPKLTHAVHWCPYSSRAKFSVDEMKLNARKRDRPYYDLTLAYLLHRCRGCPEFR